MPIQQKKVFSRSSQWSVFLSPSNKSGQTVWYYHVRNQFQRESPFYSLPECQGTPWSKQALYLKFKWQQRDSNSHPLSSSTKTQPFSQTGRKMVWMFVYELSGCEFESRCCRLKMIRFYLKKLRWLWDYHKLIIVILLYSSLNAWS